MPIDAEIEAAYVELREIRRRIFAGEDGTVVLADMERSRAALLAPLRQQIAELEAARDAAELEMLTTNPFTTSNRKS